MATSPAITRETREDVIGATASSVHLQRWKLLILLAASLAIRIIAFAYFGAGTIESEGAEYAKIAQNLRAGVGYVGLVSAGPQVLFPPLFPWLIAAASFLTPDFEFAGRLVALAFGALLPLPVFGIASRLFNRRVGWIAGILASLHPVLVSLSFSVYSEGIYATLFLTSVYCALRAMDEGSTKSWIVAGASFALSYLVRPEGFAAFAITLLFAFVALNLDYRTRVKRLACAILVFLVMAAPNIAFLYSKTGKLMLEGKSTILFSYGGGRMLAATRNPGAEFDSAGLQDVPTTAPDKSGGYPERWEEKWAFYGVNSEVQETGVAMRPFVDIAKKQRPNLRETLTLVGMGVRKNIPNLHHRLFSGLFGVLPALALLGVFCRPWKAPHARPRLYFLFVSTAPVLATFFILWGDERYYFIFVPLLIVWAANGIDQVGLWTKASSVFAGWRIPSHAAISQVLVPGLVTAAAVVGPAHQVRSLYTFSDSAPAAHLEKDIGLWIGHRQNGAIRIMDLILPLSYHANVQQHIYFPYSSGEVALRYLDTARVDYIILRKDKKFTKYYEEWLASGIPDGRAELLKMPAELQSDNIIVYRWHRPDAAQAP